MCTRNNVRFKFGPKVQKLENPPPKLNKIVTESAESSGIDWISKLPDSLIIKILSLMPIIDACKTTILSKQWNNMWTHIDNVTFGYETIWPGKFYVERHRAFLDNALCLLSCSKIKKFDLCCRPCFFLDFRIKLDKWIGIAMEKNVQDLKLKVVGGCDSPEVYYLPQVLCSSSSLEKLELSRKCSISEGCAINWISLKSLTLEYMELTDKVIAEIISGCPQLDSLKLCYFKRLQRLHMSSPRCRRLELNGHEDPFGEFHIPFEDCSLEIFAPHIEHLKISGELNCMIICLKDVSSLVRAELTFEYDDVTDLEPNRQKRLKDMVKNLLISIRCVNELTISSWFLQVVSMLETEGFSFPLLEFKRLTIVSRITKDTILGIAILLRSAPQLENLEIRGYDDDLDYEFKGNGDKAIDLVGDNHLSLTENMLKGSMKNLKNAKIIVAFCSCYYKGGVTEIYELVEDLLKHAVVLKKLVIAPFHKGEEECSICSTSMSKMREHSLGFARASRSVVSFECPRF